MIVNETSNIFGFLGAALAVVGTIVVAVINTKAKTTKREIEQAESIKKLTEKIDDLEHEFRSLKDSFTLVCDEMERNGTMTPQLKHFRKLFSL